MSRTPAPDRSTLFHELIFGKKKKKKEKNKRTLVHRGVTEFPATVRHYIITYTIRATRTYVLKGGGGGGNGSVRDTRTRIMRVGIIRLNRVKRSGGEKKSNARTKEFGNRENENKIKEK